MPRSIIKSCRLNIKSSSLDDLIDAYLDQRIATRQSVADKCKVSASTSGKVANALVECGFAEQRLYAEKNSRPSLHLFFKEGLHVLVLDLSSSVYTMNILDVYGKCIFSRTHTYDAGASYEDNLNIFLSRGGYQAKVAQKSFHAIAVILSDSPQNRSACYSEPSAYIPTMLDKAKTDRIIRSVFKPHATTYVKRSEAVSAAVDFGIIPSSSDHFGTSYIFIGTYICAFNVSHLGAIHCDINSFMLGQSSLGTVAQNFMDTDTFVSALTKIVNLMHCAYSASSVIIDSDLYTVDDDTLRIICRDCAKIGVLAPTLIASNNAPSVTQVGAMKLAFSKFIRTMILASDQKSQS